MKDLCFNEHPLLPAIVQDDQSGQVLMLAYMNREALQKTIESGQTWFFSRKRQKLWHKGETSGNIQHVRRIDYDCDGDTLLIRVNQQGPACHTGAAGCFYRTLHQAGDPETAHFLYELERIIANRKVVSSPDSYVSKLFSGGLDRILKKVGEEAGEVIIAAKNQDRQELIYEAGDLLFHLLVLLADKEVQLAEVVAELASRHQPAEKKERT